MTLEPWQWVGAAVAAVIVGLSKSGITGAGMLAVVIFAEIMPARQATGVMLPMLILGDVLGVWHYHAHAQWRHLVRLFPWTAVGVLLGYFALGRIDDLAARILIGLTVLLLIVVHFARKRAEGIAGRRWPNADLPGSPSSLLSPPSSNLRPSASAGPAADGLSSDLRPRSSGLTAAATGVLAGFTTLIANAAGPLMSVYLLAMRLPKLEFVGTAAVFFLLINVFKVPFMVDLGLIDAASLRLNLLLAPAVVAGAWLGWTLLPRINQRRFEQLVLTLSAIAGLDLCLRTIWTLLR